MAHPYGHKKVWRRRHQETGSYTRRAGQSRRRASTQQQDRYLEQEEHCQSQTVTNRLHEGGMRAQRPLVGPVLTAQHSVAWLAFAREHQNWQVHNWHPVLFTDGSRFTLSTCERVRRHHGKRYSACNINQLDWFVGGSVMVWGGQSHRPPRHGQLYPDCCKVPGWNPQKDCQTLHWSVGPGLLLVQVNAQHHMAVCSV